MRVHPYDPAILDIVDLKSGQPVMLADMYPDLQLRPWQTDPLRLEVSE